MSNFYYFHGGEVEQSSFFRIPRTLIKDEQFRGLSTEAKLLYGLMLDRMGLSLRNGWLDEENRVFIFYSLQEVQETLGCGHNKATRLLNELNQYGLIERVRQGQGKPAKIYVKNFVEEESPGQGEDEKADLKTSENRPVDCPFPNLLTAQKGQVSILIRVILIIVISINLSIKSRCSRLLNKCRLIDTIVYREHHRKTRPRKAAL